MNPSRARVVLHKSCCTLRVYRTFFKSVCRTKLFQTPYHLVRHMRGTAFETGLCLFLCMYSVILDARGLFLTLLSMTNGKRLTKGNAD